MRTLISAVDGRSADFSGAETVMDVMQISPRAQALMLAVSAAVGVAAGSIFDLIGVFYRSLGVGRVPAYYDRVLPLVGAVGRRGKVGGVAASVVLWCVDMLFPVAWASAQLCVFFATDDGVFRLSGLAAGALGFVLWRKTLGVPFRACGSFVVYVIRAAVAYICFPAVFAARGIYSGIGRVLRAVSHARSERRIKKYNARERVRIISLAGAGFGMAEAFGAPRSAMSKEEGSNENERKRKILRQNNAR